MRLTPLLLFITCTSALYCSSLDRIKVKTQWAIAYGQSGGRDQFSRALWRAVFKISPDVASLFRRVNSENPESAEFRAHGQRVVTGIDRLISLLDNEKVLQEDLAHLREQHAYRGIRPAYFRILKRAFLAVVPAALGRCYEPSVWSDCYDVIASGISSY